MQARLQISATASLVVCLIGGTLSEARPNEPPIAGAPTAAPWCGGIVDVDASAKAEAHWRSRWLPVGRNWYSAYTFGQTPTNPFDLKGKAEPALPPMAGFIWIAGVTCVMTPGPQPNETVVRVTAGIIAFNEKSKWAPPLKNVLLLDATFGPPDERRRIIDRSPETSVIAPEMKQRVPTLVELPKPSKRLKLPCKASETWKTKQCVRPL